MRFLNFLYFLCLTGFVMQDAHGIGAGAAEHAEKVAEERSLAAQESSDSTAKAADEELLKTLNAAPTEENFKALKDLREAGVDKPTAVHFALQKAELGHSDLELTAAKALLDIKVPVTKDNVMSVGLLSIMISKGIRLREEHVRAVRNTKKDLKAQKALLKGLNEGWAGGEVGTIPNIVQYKSNDSGNNNHRVFFVVYDSKGEILKRVGDTFKVLDSDSGDLQIGDYVILKSIYEKTKDSDLYKFIDFEKVQ